MIINWRKDEAYDHIVSQLHEQPNYEKLMMWIADPHDNIAEIMQFISTLNVYTARGFWLDLIGTIVGQSRFITTLIQYQYFGFAEGLQDPKIEPSIGGFGFPFFDPKYTVGETTRLNDDDYRLLIMARVARNVGKVNLPSITLSLQNMFETQEVSALNKGIASYYVIIRADVSEIFKKIIKTIDILPRAAGVGIDGAYIAPPDTKFFGFAEGLDNPLVSGMIGGFGDPLLQKFEV